jgi:PAS domain S-box-containing protein
MIDHVIQRADQQEILVVEDDPASLQLLTTILTGHGYRVRPSSDGGLALRSLAVKMPDLILLDVKMPGMDGFEVCLRLKATEICRKIPVIFISALGEATEKVRGFNVGGVDFITKPFEAEEVLARVQTHLRLRELAERLEQRVREQTEELTTVIQQLRQEISERKRAEDALKNSERRLAGIIDFLPDSTFAIDLDGKVTLWNRAAEEFTGVKAEAMLGKGDHEYSIPFYGKRRKVLIDLVFGPSEETESLYQMFKRERGVVIGESYARSIPRNEAYILGIAAPLYGSEGNIIGAIESVHDISERKRAEEQWVRLATAIEQAGEAIFMTDTDWVVFYVNPGFERMTGYGSSKIIGQHARILRSDKHDRSCYRNIRETLNRGEVWSGRLTNRKKDGTLYEAEVTASPVRDKSGVIINYVSIHRDITHEVRLERDLRQAQKMEAIGTLAGGIAHDFNNILTAIIGFSEMAHSKLPQDIPARHDLKRVLDSASRATDLVRQILTFSRQTEQELRPVQVAPVIKEALKLLRSSLPSTIEIRQDLAITSAESVVLADAVQIHQVLLNLCTNAAHAMHARGGTLSVKLSAAVADAGLVSRHSDLKEGPYVCLAVSDTGHGMDAAILERIFDPYFTTKAVGEGTGLGLAVAQGIIKSHGGAIIAYSEPGKGATFQVYLPTIERDVSLEARAAEELPGGSERILFVDDEKALVELGMETLVTLGYNVIGKTSSPEALAAFRAQPDAFDLIITDLTMPGLTGRELAREVLSIRSDIPIILCSGFNEVINEKQAEESGIREFVMKPYVLSGLAKTIRRVLERK